jgi:hypothetical protein
VATQGNSGAAGIANSTSQPTVGGGQLGVSGQAGVGGQGGQLAPGAAINTQAQLQADNQIAAGAGVNVVANDRNARWRFRQHNGEWWYWTPQNTWMIHRGGNWIVYDPATYVVPQTFQRVYVQPGYSNQMYSGDGYYYSGRRYRSGYAPSYSGGYGYDPYGSRYDSGFRGDAYGSGYGGAYVDPGYRAGANIGGAIGGAIDGGRGANIGSAIGGALGAGY